MARLLCYAGFHMQNGTLLAAVDLGSNSFRLEIGRHEDGQIHRTEYLKAVSYTHLTLPTKRIV